MGVYNYSYSKELNDALTLWDDYCKGNITINHYHPLSSVAELKVKSNQKYSNFDLATWEPWMQYGLKWCYNQDTHRYPHKKNFINIVNKDFTGFYTAQDPEIEGFIYDLNEEIQSGSLVPSTTPLSSWNGCGRDDYAFVTDNEDYKVIWVCKMQPFRQYEGVYKLLGVGLSFPNMDYQSLNLLVKDLENRLI